MKKVLFLSTVLFCWIVQVCAQDVPPYPNVDQTFKKVLSFDKVYEKLKKDYKIENPKESKFEKIMTIGGGDVIESDFSSYQSDAAKRINYRWPDDRCYTVFTVTTPESSEGVTYKLPLVVEYSRLKHGVLTNNWELYWWYYDTPYSTKGGKEDQLFYTMLIEKLKTIKGNVIPQKRDHTIPTSLEDMTTIEKIEKDPNKQDIREMKYANKDYVERQYVVYGKATKFEDYDESKVEQNFENSKSFIAVRFERPKDENGKTGEWFVSSITGTSWQIDRGTATDDQKLYQTLSSVGFEKIYKKPPIEKSPPYFSDVYEEQFNQELEQALLDLYHKKEGAAQNLQKFLIPDPKVLESFVAYFEEMHQKFVSLKANESEDESGIRSSLSVNTNPDNCKLYLYFKIKRAPYTEDKGLKNKYKDAGMSKEVLKSRYAEYNERERHDFSMELIDGQLKIAKPIKRAAPIPF